MTIDEDNVVVAALGYFEAFRRMAPELVRQTFLPSASKTGFMYDNTTCRFEALSQHGLEQIAAWATQYNANGHMPRTPAQATVLDLQEKIAVVKLKAEWASDRHGIDYVLLVKPDAEWKIANIAWQSIV
jgi:hypothetical protein